mmetsp:Transcript_11141/g.16973  ORF Transcript_11141/g.16973 Transcript_11141/m.16973 type:complete len:611 (-) Transcript_11141:210-2042(-)
MPSIKEECSLDIKEIESEIEEGLVKHDHQRLHQICETIRHSQVPSHMAPVVIKYMRRLQRCRSVHVSSTAACVLRTLLRDYTSNRSHASAAHTANGMHISLSDYLDMDIYVPRLEDRICDSNQKCSSTRCRYVVRGDIDNGRPMHAPVVYWMSRDQRIHDNWSLIRAQEMAEETESPLCVVFGLAPSFPGANLRHYGFMLRGLKLLQAEAEYYGIPVFILRGSPEETVPAFCRENGVTTLVSDFSPLRTAQRWKDRIASELVSSNIGTTFIEVDAHNVCPCWDVTPKCEFSAKTIRGKIHALVDEFLVEFPPVKEQSPELSGHTWVVPGGDRGWEGLYKFISGVDCGVDEVDWAVPGEGAAMDTLRNFLGNGGRGSRLESYATTRNDPCLSTNGGSSDLSPYMHFGHISAQRICLEVKRIKGFTTNKALFPEGDRTTGVHSFCEELVVRRELAENFCMFNPLYDSISGAHSWAQKTLREHWNDTRSVVYSEAELEEGKTSDNLWNAAQHELVYRGKMHGFMRMYWAKKILEWTTDPEDALRIAVYLNDKYSLDGRDPNGYVGCMWAIAGVHDRAWGPERPVFGKIRFMNYAGCKRKFDIDRYVALMQKLK